MSMRMTCRGLILAALLAIAPLAAAEDAAPAHPGTELATLIPKAIELLEAKKYEEVIELMASPEEIKAMKEAGEFEEVVKGFAERSGPMLEALKQIKGKEPKYNDEKTYAEFALDPEIDGRKTMNYSKTGGRWYLE